MYSSRKLNAWIAHHYHQDTEKVHHLQKLPHAVFLCPLITSTSGKHWFVLHCCLFPEKAMAPHFSTLAWKIPWMEEPGRLQSMGSLRVRHDWVTSLSLFTFVHWRRKWQCSCLENPRDGGAWWAALYGVSESRTWLKWLSLVAVRFQGTQYHGNPSLCPSE